MSRIAVQDIDKSFAERKVVSGASFYVQRGEAIGLLGPGVRQTGMSEKRHRPARQCAAVSEPTA
jgi:ABC-type lipopolysaccharide export system ATPase subunit